MMKRAIVFFGLAASLGAVAVAAVQSVSVTASASKPKANKVPVTVTLTIPQGYHIYGSKKTDTGIPTSIKMKSPNFKITASTYPPTQTYTQMGESVQVYEGKAVVKLQVMPTKKLSGKQTVKFAVTTQSCNDRTCLPAETKEVSVNVTLP